jgi:4-amino-4-deoxy-L-arabinose transferase-like glycosyltransferase
MPSRRTVACILGLLVLLSAAGLGRGLWTPDEPREAEISREMFLSPGVIPTVNAHPFAEKPPLYYWTVAAAFAAAEVIGACARPWRSPRSSRHRLSMGNADYRAPSAFCGGHPSHQHQFDIDALGAARPR